MTDLLTSGNLVETTAQFTTSGTPIALAVDAATILLFSGSSDQILRLPPTGSCFSGHRHVIANRSSGKITVQYSDTTFLGYLYPGKETEVRLSPLGTWDYFATGKSTAESPFKMRATEPVSSVLKISSSVVRADDLAAISASAVGDNLPTTGEISIDFQAASVSGGSVTVGLDGPPLASSFPTTPVGQFRRVVFSIQENSTITVAFGAAVAALNLLELGTALQLLFKNLGGTPIGYIDLESTASPVTLFKTAGSLTDVIENYVGTSPRIFRFGAGGGGSGSLSLLNGGLETEIDTTETTYSVVSGKVNFHPFMHVVTGHTMTIDSGGRLVSANDTIDGTVVVSPGGVWRVL